MDIKEKSRYMFIREKANSIRQKPLPRAVSQKQLRGIRHTTAKDQEEEQNVAQPVEQAEQMVNAAVHEAVSRVPEMRFTVKRISASTPPPMPQEQMRREVIRARKEFTPKRLPIIEKPTVITVGKENAPQVKTKTAAFSPVEQKKTPVRKAVPNAEIRTKKLRQKTVQEAKRAANATIIFSPKVAAAIRKAAASASGGVVLFVSLTLLLCVTFLCLAASVLGSPVGIVTGGGADGTPTVAEVIQTMDKELADRISCIQASAGELDETCLSYNGTDAYSYIQNMADIVAVFAVKAGLNEDEPLDVLTMDNRRIQLFREVFWDMVSLSSMVTETVEPGEELDVNDVPIPVTRRRLDIRIDTKGWQVVYHSLNADQQAMLRELMSEPLLSMIQAMCGSNSMLTLTPEQIEEMESYLPEELDPLRRKIAETAWSLVGKISYFWGGKSEVIGWDTRWGVPTIVTSTGNDAHGKILPFGLDCSGFVTWVMINATGDPNAANFIGHGTSNQWSNTTPISWSEAHPGDLVFVSPGWAADNHVGIVVGRNANGQLVVCHCSGGGVVVTTAGHFNYVRRASHILSRYEISDPTNEC